MSETPQFQHPQPQSASQPMYGQVFSTTLDTADTQTQIEVLTRRIQDLENKRVNFNTDLIGLVETIGMAPTTTTPTNPFQQFKIYSGNLYYYDGLNKVWHLAGAVAGSDTQVQFNNAGTMAGSAQFTFTTSTNTLTLGSSSLAVFNGKLKLPVGTNLYP